MTSVNTLYYKNPRSTREGALTMFTAVSPRTKNNVWHMRSPPLFVEGRERGRKVDRILTSVYHNQPS